jgi:2-methylaconitate cis-trans-isomerase PrpF
MVGMATHAAAARRESPALPRLALVGAGGTDAALSLRVLSMQRVHHACPITVLMCAAAATRLEGTVPHAVARAESGEGVRIAHPKGIVGATVRMDDGPTVRSVGVISTARRILAGEAVMD